MLISNQLPLLIGICVALGSAEALAGTEDREVLLNSAASEPSYMGMGAGAGTVTCAEFGRLMRDDDAGAMGLVFYSWAQGYMSGLNTAVAVTKPERTKDLAYLSPADQQSVLNADCDTRPLSTYAAAVQRMFMGLPVVKSAPPNQPH